MALTIRHGRPADIPRLEEIIASAKRYMAASGNLTQWAGSYPDASDLMADMKKGNNYVGIDTNGNIVMTFCLIFGDDPTYNVIEDGEWLNNEPYGTIHRIASDGSSRGVLEAAVDFAFLRTDNVRIDTHADNTPMLSALERLEFVKCGLIYCRDGSPRIAFQKTKSDLPEC